ncbi:MAG: ATP-dependent DNA helicase PcrA [Firmicutes bacterium ADurb.Bin193]|nr:MAG: ATP-dependent DNA helicase PcrA [Firmicutes bacterium ADurb.Bin193]
MLDLTFPKLNDKQREAVFTTEGPVLILAGAGSGKTTVLVNRIAYLIEKKSVSPHSILAITFTNKAAGELESRLSDMLGDEGRGIWAKTFHSACVRFLRRDIGRLGYRAGFSIFDTADQVTVMKECLKSLGLSDKNFPPKQILSLIGRLKDTLTTPEEFIKEYPNDYYFSHVGKLYELYQQKLISYGAVDFDDIIMLAVRLFEENPDVLDFYRKKFKYILVDEYQDTNHAQYRLVSLLAEPLQNLCVVGDDDQSIYKFRGANIENILSFEKQFPNTKIIKLEENYRSTQNILNAANGVIKNNRGRRDKSLWTSRGRGERVNLFCGYNEYAEAEYIAEKIASGGRSYGDFAVLYRMNAQSRVIENALLQAAIPYRVVGGLRFYDRKEIKDAVAYLRLISNLDDNVSLKRIINEPKRKLGKTTIDEVEVLSARQGIGMLAVCENAGDYPSLSKAAPRLKAFADMIKNLQSQSRLPLDEFLRAVLTETNYIPALEAENIPENMTRLENLHEFINSAKEYELTDETPSLEGFLENIALIADVDNYDETQDAVALMTLHSAKGLEFPVVFLAGAEEGIFPGYQSIAKPEELEEERCLCYVGITRAKEELHITHTKTRTLFGTTAHNPVSRFVGEIPPEVLTCVQAPLSSFARSEYTSESAPSLLTHRRNAPSTAASKPKVTMSFSAGERVLHKKFGEGIILKATEVGNDFHLEIAFKNAGTKNLLAAYANLSKLQP